MNNLKRVLSLALASVMVLGMMVVGASATDYPDDDKIVNQEAVETMKALGIMTGDETGFRPEDTLTRAEAAKMLAFIFNKGRNVTYGTKSDPSFTDIQGKWFEPWIEYAYAMNIVKGNGDGTFSPDGILRAVELLRMVLNMMGYEEGSSGSDWELQTIVKAEELGLIDLDDETLNPTGNISRDNAAQVIFNSLPVPMAGAEIVTSTVCTLTETGNDPITFSSVTEALLYAQVKGLASNAYTISQTTDNDTETLGAKFLSLKDKTITVTSVSYDATKTAYSSDIFTTPIDLSQYMGQKVKVLYKDNDAKTVYGVLPQGSVVFTGTVADYVAGTVATDRKFKLAGTEYKADATTLATTGWNGATVTPNPWDELIAVDADNDDDVDALLVKPVEVSKVKTVASDGKTITINGVALDSDSNPTALKIADHNIAEGLEDNDWVISTYDSVKSIWTVTKAESVENVLYTKSSTAGYVLGGVTYKDSASVMTPGQNAPALGKSYDLVVYGGYIFAIGEYTPEGPVADVKLSDVVYVTHVAKKADAVSANDDKFTAVDPSAPTKYTIDVKILKQDNTPETITVTTVNGEALDVTPAADQSNPNDTVANLAADKLYTMTTNNKGEIDLAEVKADNENKWNGMKKVTVNNADNIENGLLGANRIAENAVIFVKFGTKVECLDGKTVAGWTMKESTNFTSAAAYAKEDNKTGYEYINLGILLAVAEIRPDAVSDKSVGFITASAAQEYLLEGDKGAPEKGTYYTVTIWDGEIEKEYISKDALTGDNFKAGKFVTFTVTGGVAKVEALTPAPVKDAIKAFDGEEYTTDSGTFTGKASTTIVIYIDDAKNAKADAATIKRADKAANSTTLVKNVYTATVDGTKVLFVDVNNKVDADPAPQQHAHIWTQVEAKAATCTEDGNIEYYHCTAAGCDVSDKNYSDEGTTEIQGSVTLAASGHGTLTWDEADAASAADATPVYEIGDHIGTCPTCTKVVKAHTAATHTGNGDGCEIGD